MELKTEAQRDAIVDLLKDSLTPIVMQTRNVRGVVTIFTGVGTDSEASVSIGPEGAVKTRGRANDA